MSWVGHEWDEKRDKEKRQQKPVVRSFAEVSSPLVSRVWDASRPLCPVSHGSSRDPLGQGHVGGRPAVHLLGSFTQRATVDLLEPMTLAISRNDFPFL